MRRMHAKLGLLTTLLLLLAWAACGEDDPGENFIAGPEPGEYPVATTPDTLVGNLVRVYNGRSYEKYDDLLAEGFVFYFPPDEVEELGQGLSYDRAQDTRSTFNMFNGQPGQTPAGAPVAPVQKIQLTLAPDDADAPWTDQVPEQFAGTTMRRYKADMVATYADGNRERVTGLQEFYAVAVEVDATTTVYQMKYWRDLGKAVTKASTEEASWGSVKAQF